MQFPRLTRWACNLDDFLRQRDFAAGRTVGGFLDRRFGIRRHTLWALILPSAVCSFAVTASPNLPRIVFGFAAAVVVFFLLALVMASFSRKNRPLGADLYLQLGTVSLVVLLIGIFCSSQYSDVYPYRNVFLPLTLAVTGALFVAGVCSNGLFKNLRNGSNLAHSLSCTELFADRGPVLPVTGAGLFTAICLVPFRAPLELLLPPAITALLARPEWLSFAVIATFAVCFCALILSGLNERFGMMWSLLSHPFVHGGALLISWIVIALATARFLGVTYVTTVFDTAAGWVVLTVLLGIYVLSWWFSYWMDRLLSDQFVRVIDPNCSSGEVRLPYPIAGAAVATSVPADGRVLQLHGSSRFMALRDKKKEDEIAYFQSYPALDLLSALALVGAPGGRAVPTYLQLKGRAFTFHGLITALLALIFIAGAIVNRNGTQNAELTTQLDTGGGISLATLLQKPSDDHRILVIAASGGGTRAALFTAAILEGIASRGKADDLVLGSGVSGGGAALAYYAGFRSSLTQYDTSTRTYNQAAWKQYYEAMQESYIRNVLERASEWRIVRGGRLGMLLRESFCRRWGLAESASHLDTCSFPESAAGCAFGLILNTTLAGRLHLSQLPPGGQSLADVEPAHRADTTSSLAGGRLILTNLDVSGFVSKGLEPDDPGLPIVIRGPSVHLEHAAALNANFPPVFANAAIDANKQDRYWVTDGGAADNRGMEMLLYAIRSALSNVSADRLPRLHIIVADAGAYSDDFVQDRGVSSTLGAGAHFASALDAQLESAITQLYKAKPGRFGFSYVYMPRPLRASGSFGTHWMLQNRITVHQRKEPSTLFNWRASGESSASVTITGKEMIDVLRSLYTRIPLTFEKDTAGKPLELGANACKVLLWARQESSGEHSREKWREVMHALGDDGSDPASSCPP